jgi:hypothetical protein
MVMSLPRADVADLYGDGANGERRTFRQCAERSTDGVDAVVVDHQNTWPMAGRRRWLTIGNAVPLMLMTPLTTARS